MTCLRPRRRPRFALVTMLFVMVLVGVSCSSTLDNAATVDGEGISRRDFERELERMLENEAFVEALRQADFELPESGDAGAVIDARLSSLWLDTLIDQVVIDAEFAERGLDVDDTHREQARTRMQSFFTTVQTGADAEPIVVFDQFDEELRDLFIERNARAIALASDSSEAPTEDLTEAELRDFYDEQVTLARDQCPLDKRVAHVLVETETEGDAVLERLAAGEDFATLAIELSTDTGSGAQGGELGCLTEGQFVGPFEDAAVGAPLGEPVGPVETEFGFHVILVQAVVPPFEDVRDQIRAQLQQQAADQAAQAADAVLAEIVTERLSDAEVTVDARYGRWVVDENGPRVEPPETPDVREGRETTATTLPGLLDPEAPPGG